ncbi:MAG: hypothetical protein KC645_14540 [Gemmatimonadetes bacterium]|nr:hypothetical protein [Gemmatimonadota bacterium]
MSDSRSIWFRLGYALERTRRAPAPRLRALTERRPARASQATEDEEPAGASEVHTLLRDLGLGLLLKAGAKHARPEFRAALTGALAAGSAQAVISLLRGGRIDVEELRDDVVRGAAVGMAYAAFLGPWLPGPALLRGALLGLGTWSARGAGGALELLGPLGPHHRVPGLAALFDVDTPEPDTLTEHLLFGVTFAALYRSRRVSSGISGEE